jgi:hypothetical protein
MILKTYFCIFCERHCCLTFFLLLLNELFIYSMIISSKLRSQSETRFRLRLRRSHSQSRNENFFGVKIEVKSEEILHGQIAQKRVYILKGYS